MDITEIEIKKLIPEQAEEYARFFDDTPHNNEFGHVCYCVSWCSDEAAGDSWPVDRDERRRTAIERVRKKEIQGYLALHDN